MKILLLGKNGQVGWELQRALAPLGDLITLDRRSNNALCGDLSRLNDLTQTIRTLQPHVIVNAAAYTAVDKAETEQNLANLINVEAPRRLADEAAALGAWLVHYSSDYVFDGSGMEPWKETDKTNPINYYGKTKEEGEKAILASGCKHLIFRTSWVYAARGNNFIKTMLHLASEREDLNVINDQIGVPTGAELLADITAHALRYAANRPEVSGIYHLAPNGETTWYGYANFVIKKAQRLGEILRVRNILPIPSSNYVTPAKRPLNSRLNTNKLTTTFSLQLPHWEMGVTRMLDELIGSL